MKGILKISKYLGLSLTILLAFACCTYLFISHEITARAEKTYRFPPVTLPINGSKNLIDRGAHLIAIKGCNDCHGTDLGGKVFLNESGLGKISASNLSAGIGGIGRTYQITDWVMALRHGVNQNGKPLLIMPSQESAQLSDEDLTAIIAYCRQIKPVHRKLDPQRMGPLLKILSYFDKIPLFPVEKIDHNKSPLATTTNLSAVEMGSYLSVSCIGCHRPNFKGGESPIPGMPMVPDITSAGNPGKWTLAQFIKTLKTGQTPEGKTMDNQNMPWKMTAKYTDEELRSLFTFLKSKQ